MNSTTSSHRHPIDELADDFLSRYRRGERPALSEYTQKHPELAEKIRTLFPTVVMMEDLKHCRLHESHRDPLSQGKMPEKLGEFRVIRELGRGGMGIVYEAEQESLGRRVAIKVLTSQALLDPVQLRRFRREAQMMARLHHTNIVPVFSVGEHEGLLFYAMQLIEGRGLDSLLSIWRNQATSMLSVTVPGSTCSLASNEKGLNETRDGFSTESPVTLPKPQVAPQIPRERWTEIASIMLQVTDALAYAHAQGTFHRDIKPSNLLLDERGNAWITDFGLAKLVEHDDLSRPGETAGTLRYMAPERFQGQSDGRSDLYSLGLTLYELATLCPAFDEKDRGKLVKQVMEQEPTPPRKLLPALPRDLETIILRCIAREPAQRYRSAVELAGDLRLFLDDKPVKARRVTVFEKMGRWCKRNPAIASLIGLVIGLLCVIAGVSSAAYVQTRQALTEVDKAYVQTKQALTEVDKQKVEAEKNLALAQAEHRSAVKQHLRAEENLNLALTAFEEIFAQATRRTLTHSPDPTAGPDEADVTAPPVVSPEVAALLHNLLKFYDQFGQQNGSDPRLQRETARAYHRVGDIEQRLGHLEQAEQAYLRALALYKKYASTPGAGDCVREMAASLNELGLVLQMTGRAPEAKKLHLEAFEVLTGPPGTNPEELPAWRRFRLARTLSILSSLSFREAKFDEGSEKLRTALKLLEALLQDEPNNPDYRLTLARCYRNLWWGSFGRPGSSEAEKPQSKAIAILEKLTQEFPSVPDYRYELSEVLMRSFVTHRGRPFQRSEAVEQQLLRAADLAKELVQAHAAVPDYQSLRARSLYRLGIYFEKTNRQSEAEPNYLEAVTLHRQLVSKLPTIPLYHHYLAEECQSLSGIMLQRKDWPRAEELLREAIQAQQTSTNQLPQARFSPFNQIRYYQSLTEVLRKQNKNEEADKFEAEANKLIEKSRKPR